MAGSHLFKAKENIFGSDIEKGVCTQVQYFISKLSGKKKSAMSMEVFFTPNQNIIYFRPFLEVYLSCE